MSTKIRDIAHPLRRGGLSRPERDLAALDTATAPLDGRSLGDLLRFWYDFARQVNYHTPGLQPRTTRVSGDWLDFFRRSHPFQYAKIAAYDLEALDARFREIDAGISARRTLESLNPLLDLLLEISGLLATWQADLAGDRAGLLAVIAGLIETSLREPIRGLLAVVNGAAAWGYQPPVTLDTFREPYGLSFTDPFAADGSVAGRRGSLKAKVLDGRDRLAETYRLLWQALRATVAAAQEEDRIEDSLRQPLSADTSPHLGLVFSFLLLYRDAQPGLNQLTDRHLDFFYRQTLQLQELPLVNDRAHLVFELGKRVEDAILVERGRRFKAGKDAAGTEITFATEEEVVLTQTQVAEQRTLFLGGGQLFAAPLAASGDGAGGDFPKDTPAVWPTLGGPQGVYPSPETELFTPLPPAALGSILASPVLLLREGERTVTVTLKLGPDAGIGPLPTVSAADEMELFTVSLTTEAEWLPVPQVTTTVTPNPAERTLTLVLRFTLPPDFPAVVNPGPEIYPLGIPDDLPALRLDLIDDLADRLDWYCKLGQLPVLEASIDVAVKGVRNLRLENDFSALDPTKAFMPFGPTPKANAANFYVGSEEVFVKRWRDLTLNLEWLDLPATFDDYYAAYPNGGSWEPEKVEAEVKVLDGGKTHTTANQDLLTSDGEGQALSFLINEEEKLGTEEEVVATPCSWPLNLPRDLSAGNCGLFHLQLGGQDFLHHEYPQAILDLAIENERITVANNKEQADYDEAKQKHEEDPENNPLPAEIDLKDLLVLNPPYTPNFSGISINYSASDSLDQEITFAHLHPWENTYAWLNLGAAAGAEEVIKETNFPLLPAFPGEGHLYLGLAGF
ncbi:MAG: hypothetical protein AAFZ52_15110, partial [Bacteroidota bacterium]